MSEADRELVRALRAELAAIDPTRPCDRAAEVAGLGTRLSTVDPAVARLVVRLGGGAIDADRLLDGARRRRRMIVSPGPDGHDEPGRAAAKERAGSGEGSDGAEARPGERASERLADWPWERSADHCRVAWLRGLFLAHGSLSLAGARSHLEFVVDPAEGRLLAARVASLGLPASVRVRRGRGVVTWKSGETIVHFLRLAGASASLLELEARAVSRALRGDLNRVINAEASNLIRAVAASARQLEAIELLEAEGRLGAQPYVVRVVAAARREVPEATLSEIAERAGVHRSAAQRALERIERLAFEGGAPGRAGSRSGVGRVASGIMER